MSKFVTIESEKKANLLRNLYMVVGTFAGVWMIFHLTTVFFFGFIVGSPLLIGIFLGIGSIWAMIIDIPLGTIQRYFQAKTLIITALSCMIIACLIFLYFIYSSNDLSFAKGDNAWETTVNFFDSGINIFLLLTVGILYGTAKESYDVSALAYLLNLTDPSEYAESLSKNNIAYGVGAVIGVLIAIVILGFKTDATQLVLFSLLFFIICAIIFISNYFDNAKARIKLSEITELRITKPDIDVKQTKQYIQKKISTADFEQIKSQASYILMKPREVHRKLDYQEMKANTKEAYGSLMSLVANKTSRINRLLWLVGAIFLFGFWDTVVVTFFVAYIDQVLNGSGGDTVIRSGFFVLGLLALPAYLLQFPFIKASKQHGHYPIVTMGLFISAVALFGLGIMGEATIPGLIFAILFGMMNSAGYAAGFPLSQSVFAEAYNIEYANRTKGKSIDADVSAGPLKILNNFANAVGLISAGALISWFGYRGMFIIFGLLVLFWAIISVIKKDDWELEKS